MPMRGVTMMACSCRDGLRTMRSTPRGGPAPGSRGRGPKAYARPRTWVARRTPPGAPHPSRAAGESAFHLRPERFALDVGLGGGRRRGGRGGQGGRRRRGCPERDRLLVGTALFRRGALASAAAATTAATATTTLTTLAPPVSSIGVVASRAPPPAAATTTPTAPSLPSLPSSPATAPTPILLRRGPGGIRPCGGGLNGGRTRRDQLDPRLEVRVHLHPAH